MYNKQSADDRERYENEMRLFQCQQRLMTVETQSAAAPAPAAAPAMVAAPAPPVVAPLPSGWTKEWSSKRGMDYYFNCVSRRSQWHFPVTPMADMTSVIASFNERRSARKDSCASQGDPENITIHHPCKGDLCASLRIGNCGKIRSTGRQAGCSGYSIDTVRTALAGWHSDGIRFKKMKFWDPESIGSRPFIKSTETMSDFQTLVIGKERESGVGKAAFLNTKTNRIVLRTATCGTPTRKAYDTYSDNWKVETGLFNADKGFWKRLRKHDIFKVSEI